MKALFYSSIYFNDALRFHAVAIIPLPWRTSQGIIVLTAKWKWEKLVKPWTEPRNRCCIVKSTSSDKRCIKRRSTVVSVCSTYDYCRFSWHWRNCCLSENKGCMKLVGTLLDRGRGGRGGRVGGRNSHVTHFFALRRCNESALCELTCECLIDINRRLKLETNFISWKWLSLTAALPSNR